MTTTETARPTWEPCDSCGSPLDEVQRYCVICGARRPRPNDPVARYFAGAARRARAGSTPAPDTPTRTSSGLRTAVILALIPVAAAVGVQVGRGDSDEAVLDALKSQKAPVVRVVGGGGTAAAAAGGGAAVASDFALGKGFAIRLKTLPVDGTTQDDVDAAVADFESQGIKDVGVITPEDFTVKPSGGDKYAIVSGAFEKRVDAERALKGIKKKVKGAAVIEVSRKAEGGGSGSGGDSKIIARGKYGAARQLTGAKTTQKDLEESKTALDHIVNSKGKEYVEQQRNLPDQIVIP